MNTSKDNLEWQIKKQIEEREVAPSRDLWSEIEWQTQNNKTPKLRVNRILVAACIILTFSLGTVLLVLKDEPSVEQPKIVKEVKEQNEDKIITAPNNDNPVLAAQNPVKQDIKNIPSKEKTEKITAISVPDKNTIITKEGLSPKKLEVIRITDPKILAKADSSKIQVKKKKYVDPSTLLFSVEHKDVIEKTKDGSNVATIELNRN